MKVGSRFTATREYTNADVYNYSGTTGKKVLAKSGDKGRIKDVRPLTIGNIDVGKMALVEFDNGNSFWVVVE